MGYIKEPDGVDFYVISKEWTVSEREEMRILMQNSRNEKQPKTLTIPQMMRTK